MVDTETRSTPSPEEGGLETNPWGTRFVRPETEAAYRHWHFVQSVPLNRAGGLLSLFTWFLAAAYLGAVRPAGFMPWLVGIGLEMLILVVALGRIDRPNVWAWSAPLVNAVAGALVVAMSSIHFRQLELSTGAVMLCSVYAFLILRIRPRSAGLAAASYTALQVALLVAAFRRAELGSEALALAIFLLVAGFATLVFAAVVLDIGTRRAFRQERIIEAQKATIARERARSEAALKRELGHQVAERSRELGAVLAKSDVSLDVRRLSSGERFDARYRIVAPLGAGGMGVVYEVERIADGERLALKAVVGEVSSASAARFAREAEIGARMQHDNLVSIVDVGVSSGVPFLVMELVRGSSLESQRVRFGETSWALPILRQIATGLAALHDAGVVHRDLKPANVLLAGDASAPNAKISDFGISRFGVLDAAASIDPTAATLGPSPSPKVGLVTGTGVVMGTPLYMAPEAAHGGRALDSAADVFALGIIAYEMLTGRPPFSVPAVVLAMAAQPTPLPPAMDAGLSSHLRALVLECLSEDPARRPRVRTFLEGLSNEIPL